ncbi:MAG: hypothetical protein K0B87_02190 [Candidatus Syntrophosphaera sp.]|nr:hypothetical protein [Candidatus Syntrophosphaera sp.]
MPRIIPLLLFLLISFGLAAQIQFDIQAFSDSTKYGWQDWRDRSAYREELLDRQQLLHMYEIESSPIRTTILKSVMVPGFGQISSKAGTKGTVILSSELLALGASLYFWDRSRFYYNKYLDATQVDEIQEYYSAAQNPRQYSMLFLGLGAVIWAYNIFDVILTTDEYNAQVWQEIVDKYGKKTLTMGPDGLQLKF